MDHIFPRSFFTQRILKQKGISSSKWDFYLENYDYIGNLQLLEGIQNEEKSNRDFDDWLQENCSTLEERNRFLERNLIPREIDLGFDNFEEFFREREKLILTKFTADLDTSISP